MQLKWLYSPDHTKIISQIRYKYGLSYVEIYNALRKSVNSETPQRINKSYVIGVKRTDKNNIIYSCQYLKL